MRLQSRSDSTVEFYTLRDAYTTPTTRHRIQLSPIQVSPVADPIAKLTRECSALRLKLATAERRGRSSASASSSAYPLPSSFPRTAPASARTPPSSHLALALDSVLAQRDAARTHVHAEAMKLAERCKALEKTLRDMQDALRARDREIDALRAERDRLVAEREDARAKSRSVSRDRSYADDRMSSSRGSLSVGGNGERLHRHRDRSRSRRAVVRRSDEIPPLPPLTPPLTLDTDPYARTHGSDVFLTKADGWSGAQIIQAVDDLNAEINQFAAASTESCLFSKRSGAKTPLSMSPEQENTTPWLGPALSRILALRDHSQDPILVQLALQASLVTCCSRSLSLFCVGFPSKLDALLSRVLAHMQSSEPQATSSRWRALTHRSIRSLYPGLEEYAVSELVTTMLRWSNAVFALCGSGGASASAASALHPQLRRIAEAVYRLARVTREDVLSTSFEVLTVEGGARFDPARMLNKMREGEHDDEHAALGASSVLADVGMLSLSSSGGGNGGVTPADGGAEAGRVLCTTELGLRCVTRREARASVYASAEGDGASPFESRMLLLPKVLLDSAMDVIERG